MPLTPEQFHREFVKDKAAGLHDPAQQMAKELERQRQVNGGKTDEDLRDEAGAYENIFNPGAMVRMSICRPGNVQMDGDGPNSPVS